MRIDKIPILRWLLVPYSPSPDDHGYIERAETQSGDGVEVTLAVLDAAESRRFFGVPMARRGIQPVWLRIVNHSAEPYRLNFVGIDPNYYSAYEAAAANHFSGGRRILEFGMLALVFFPVLWLLPIKLFAARRANRKMDTFFQDHAFRMRPVPPGETQEGFVFTPLDAGNKTVHVRLLGSPDTQEFVFSVSVPGLNADYLRHEFEFQEPTDSLIECDIPTLRARLAEAPAATSNHHGLRFGDPANLVVIGEFATLINAFGPRWDLTETITLATCAKTFRAFMTGWEYRYSPVSALFLFGRSQDFALQRVRKSINERLHLRLWMTPMRYQGLPVWVGQVSRDIGVRFTWRTWNLTTHRIDPNVDEARDYVVEDLLQAERLELAGYVDGVGACDRDAPRRNLTGDPYYTDGKRAAVVVSQARTTPKFIAWS
jgi:LssY C-terminus